MSFPSLIPSGRQFKPSTFPITRHRMMSGTKQTILYANSAFNAQLRLIYANITPTDATAFMEHYDYLRGTFGTFKFSNKWAEQVWGGWSKKGVDEKQLAMNGKWRYAAPPRISQPKYDVVTVEIALKQVPGTRGVTDGKNFTTSSPIPSTTSAITPRNNTDSIRGGECPPLPPTIYPPAVPGGEPEDPGTPPGNREPFEPGNGGGPDGPTPIPSPGPGVPSPEPSLPPELTIEIGSDPADTGSYYWRIRYTSITSYGATYLCANGELYEEGQTIDDGTNIGIIYANNKNACFGIRVFFVQSEFINNRCSWPERCPTPLRGPEYTTPAYFKSWVIMDIQTSYGGEFVNDVDRTLIFGDSYDTSRPYTYCREDDPRQRDQLTLISIDRSTDKQRWEEVWPS